MQSFTTNNKSINRSKVPTESQPKNPTSLELIKKVCDSYGLTRREVFEIHSQFKAMTIPFENKVDKSSNINDDYFEALKNKNNRNKFMILHLFPPLVVLI